MVNNHYINKQEAIKTATTAIVTKYKFTDYIPIINPALKNNATEADTNLLNRRVKAVALLALAATAAAYLTVSATAAAITAAVLTGLTLLVKNQR